MAEICLAHNHKGDVHIALVTQPCGPSKTTSPCVTPYGLLQFERFDVFDVLSLKVEDAKTNTYKRVLPTLYRGSGTFSMSQSHQYSIMYLNFNEAGTNFQLGRNQ